MKKRILKDSIRNIIIIEQILIIMLFGADTTSLIQFILSKSILVILFILNHIILQNHTTLFDED